MPVFKIRAWAQQTLTDSRTYEIEADTLQEATDKIARAQYRADFHGRWIDINTWKPSTKFSHDLGYSEIVMPLDPNEVTDGDSGFVLVNDDGGEDTLVSDPFSAEDLEKLEDPEDLD